MDSKLRKMAILASMAVILLVALLVMYVNREQFTAASGPPASGTQNAGAGDSASPAENGDQAEETVSPDGQIGNDLKAFLKDNTFFDQEVNPILEAAKDNSNRLSLVATSIEKDLRDPDRGQRRKSGDRGELLRTTGRFGRLQGSGSGRYHLHWRSGFRRLLY